MYEDKLNQILDQLYEIEDEMNDHLNAMEYNQLQIVSGDNAIYRELQDTRVAVYTVAVVFTLYIIMYYIVRCLK